MILDLLMLITLLNVGLIVYPDGLQVKATSTESNSKVSAVRDNNTDVPHGANLSDTLPLLAIFPEGTQISPFGFNTDGEGKLQIEILFNKPVDTSTVIPGSSLILAMETNPKATVTMKWDLNNRFLTIEPMIYCTLYVTITQIVILL
jgi:hypothetical protein